jgi:hypothetical protein
VQKSVEVDLALIGDYDQLLSDVELTIIQTAKQHHAQTLDRLQSVPGIGKILSLVLLYEMQQFPLMTCESSMSMVADSLPSVSTVRFGLLRRLL